MDFNKPIFEVRAARKLPFLAAHRGVNGANVPCNTLLSYKIAVDQGADVVEIDVTKSRDGVFFVFHPGMEHVYLKAGKDIPEMTADEVRRVPIQNCDECDTHYRVPTLDEVLAFLKGKVYINVDKFWTDVEGITAAIRKAGVEKQVIVKTYTDEESLERVEKYAPDLMFMPLVSRVDTTTERLLKCGINFIGNEVLFETETDEVITDAYIARMHERGLLVWANTIVYDERANISAGHTDDISLEKGGEYGWGYLADKKVDFIQTDWLLAAKQYLLQKG